MVPRMSEEKVDGQWKPLTQLERAHLELLDAEIKRQWGAAIELVRKSIVVREGLDPSSTTVLLVRDGIGLPVGFVVKAKEADGGRSAAG